MPGAERKLAEETIAPEEAAVTAEFIAFLKAVSAKRYPTGVMRRFNQARHAGCVEAEFTVLGRPAHRASGRPVRAAPVVSGLDPVRQRVIRDRSRERHPRDVNQAAACGRREPDAWRDGSGLRPEQPPDHDVGRTEGVPGAAPGDGVRRVAAHPVLPLASGRGAHRGRRRASIRSVTSRFPTGARRRTFRRRPRGQVHRPSGHRSR